MALDSGVLWIRVPRGALTAGQRDWLAQHWTEIAALLAERAYDREASADDLQSAFDERAAIAAVDSGLGREAADWLARQEVTSGPTGDDVTAWRSWMHRRGAGWQAGGPAGRGGGRNRLAGGGNGRDLPHPPAAQPAPFAGRGGGMVEGLRL